MGFQNFYATKLQNSIGASDTTIKVQTPPTVTSGRLVLEPRNPSKREIIQFTGVSGTDLTGVVRGIGGTSPTPHNNGSLVQMSVVAEDLDDALNINGNLTQYTDEMFADNVVRGTGEITTVSGRTASISDMTYYMGGIRLTKTGIPNKTFTASRDTYCYIDTLGAVSYIEVTVNAAAPATPANSIPFAKVVTSASAITSVTRMSRSASTGDASPSAILSFKTPATGDVYTVGQNQTVELDNFETNRGDAIIFAYPGVFEVREPGYYLASLNLYKIDAATAGSVSPRIRYKTNPSSPTLLVAIGSSISVAGGTGGQPVPAPTAQLIRLEEGGHVEACVSTAGGNIRFGSPPPAGDNLLNNFTLAKVGDLSI